MEILTLVLIAIVAVMGYRMLTNTVSRATESNVVNAFSENLVVRTKSNTVLTKLEISDALTEKPNAKKLIADVDDILGLGGAK